jgi:hypothetical protein
MHSHSTTTMKKCTLRRVGFLARITIRRQAGADKDNYSSSRRKLK